MILVTGASGFVGAALCDTLRVRGIGHRGAVRQTAGDSQVAVGDLGSDTDWTAALQGCQAVVHLAARVHVMHDTDGDPLRAYREVNVAATLNLARQAHRAGVQRFVFVSSIKVNGEETKAKPFRASDQPAPVDPYGQSKLEAELALAAFSRDSGMEIVVVRPPLVYGPGVKANFLKLIGVTKAGYPLPFGRVRTRRSMVALDNLIDLLLVCCQHAAAPGGVFLVSDGQDLTIGELVTMIARSMRKRIVLLPVPVSAMRLVAGALGKSAVADRLLGALQVDISDTCSQLQWAPVTDVQSAIDRTVAHFLYTELQVEQ